MLLKENEMSDVRVIIINPLLKVVREDRIKKPTLQSMQRIVNGKLDLIRDLTVKGIQVDTWVNDEFLFIDEPACYVGEFMIKGNAILASYDPNTGNTVDLHPLIKVEHIQEIVRFPEVH